MALLLLVVLSLFLIDTHFENLTYSALMVKKFKNLKNPFEGLILSVIPTIFNRDLVRPDIYNRLKFEYCAVSGLKVPAVGWEEKKRKTTKEVPKPG